jgi:hypothetical protein
MEADSTDNLSFVELQSFLSGKSVAIIGNASSIFNDALGAEIDTHDVVIRINYGYIKDTSAQGSKTTIWAGSVALDEHEVETRFAPIYAMWMTPRRRSLPDYSPAFRRKLFMHPVEIWDALQKELGAMGNAQARPTTGAMLINFVVKHCAPSRVRLYGFDFFKTKTFYEKRLPKNKPHDFHAEEIWARALCTSIPILEIRTPQPARQISWIARILCFITKAWHSIHTRLR